jgi:hypothetical protein
MSGKLDAGGKQNVQLPFVLEMERSRKTRLELQFNGQTAYRRLWGIDNITLKATASGSVIRFSYMVVDANKAKVLNDKKEDPYLLVQKNGAKLEVPATEKVGKQLPVVSAFVENYRSPYRRNFVLHVFPRTSTVSLAV